jgi:uncharacterized protein YpmS
MTKEAKENIQSWIKIIIISVLIPIISVYASFRVLEYRMDRQESELNKKVDAVWYEQYITNQSKLIKRLEDDSKTRDENTKGFKKFNQIKTACVKDLRH